MFDHKSTNIQFLLLGLFFGGKDSLNLRMMEFSFQTLNRFLFFVLDADATEKTISKQKSSFSSLTFYYELIVKSLKFVDTRNDLNKWQMRNKTRWASMINAFKTSC